MINAGDDSLLGVRVDGEKHDAEHGAGSLEPRLVNVAIDPPDDGILQSKIPFLVSEAMVRRITGFLEPTAGFLPSAIIPANAPEDRLHIRRCRHEDFVFLTRP